MREILMYPHSEWIEVAGQKLHIEQIIAILEPILTEDRIESINKILPKRTRNIAVVLEQIYDIGNINAVIRSMEGMGYHALHNIKNDKLTKSNRITRGADKWLDINQWDNTKECIEELKNTGHKIVVTALDDRAVAIDEIDFTEKTAICFGCEGFGATKELLDLADQTCIIPMDGFSQSYNISVAAALSLQYIQLQRKEKIGNHGDLPPKDERIIRANYYLQSTAKPIEYLMKHLLSHPNNREILDRSDFWIIIFQ